ncbi:hypothetical protein [Streptomyces sp. SUK 48]|uniref:hypothetical protein n=1 Tax=Streptomyces sp. SUK 48 TaxID=2582831 RepID=UPI00129B65DC|nr:hypothetical protein [Streptomyces sp. SUK 48]
MILQDRQGRESVKRKTWIITGVAVLAFGGVLSLFEDEPDKATADPKPSASAPAKQPEQHNDKPAETPTASGIPSPDTGQRVSLIRALRTVDASLVANEGRAVDRARNVCLDVKEGKPAATIQGNAKARFEGGTVPSLTDDQAAEIVTAVKSSFCH